MSSIWREIEMDKKKYTTPEAEYVELEKVNVILDSVDPAQGGQGITTGGTGNEGWDTF